MNITEARNSNLVDNSSISIREAKEAGIIPASYSNLIQDTCECGSDIATTRQLTKQFCVDPNCYLKMAGRAVKALNNFGLKGIGRSYCISYFRANPQFKSHLAILYGKRDNYYKTGRIADSDKLMENLYQIRTVGFTFGNLVSRLGLPELGSRANMLFKKFNSYKEFEKFLEDENITLKEYLLCTEGIDYILADKLCRTLTVFHDDLVSITDYFRMKPSAQLQYELCLTGDMNYKSFTKKEFMIFLNMIGEGYIEFIQTEARMRSDFIVSKNANVYVKDADGNVILDDDGEPIVVDYTAKHNVGKQRNKVECRKVLIEPKELYNFAVALVVEMKKGGKKK